jgi:hypothetical protein
MRHRGVEEATMTSTPEELEADRLAFVASVEDGSLRARVDAKVDPEWNAKYGDASWEAALMCIGYGPIGPSEPPKPDGKG